MIDRASTFADPEIVNLLKTKFVPVAINQAYQRQQKDAEGEFYRKIAGQGPRKNFNNTTQGFYIATPSGDLLLYNNNRDVEKVRRLMQQKLSEFTARPASTTEVVDTKSVKLDPRFNTNLPEGGLVIRVRAKVLDGYEPTTDRFETIFQTALSRDNLWTSKAEHESLVKGTVPASLQERIARFHLVDNTRGEPPMWSKDEIRKLDIKLANGKLTGNVHLETKSGDRGYTAELLGVVETKDRKVVRFDVVALGEFWGEGPFTGNAPKGKFPLAIAFTLADDSDVADKLPPQGSRGWLQGYLPR